MIIPGHFVIYTAVRILILSFFHLAFDHKFFGFLFCLLRKDTYSLAKASTKEIYGSFYLQLSVNNFSVITVLFYFVF